MSPADWLCIAGLAAIGIYIGVDYCRRRPRTPYNWGSRIDWADWEWEDTIQEIRSLPETADR